MVLENEILEEILPCDVFTVVVILDSQKKLPNIHKEKKLDDKEKHK